VDVESIPQQPLEKTAPVESADVVVGLLATLANDAMQAFFQALHELPGSPKIVVLHGEPGSAAAAATPQAVEGNSSVSVLPWSMLNAEPATPVQGISAAFRSLFAATEKLGARGCCLVASEMENATPDWVCRLLDPLLESEMDLVVPYYTPHKWQGLLNNSILYPLIRSLYGKRIHNPLGPDVGVSRRLAQKLAGATRNGNAGFEQVHPLASLTPVSVCENLQICQVRVGSRVYPPTDWINLSSLVAQVLGPIFLEMERGAPCWQRTRGSVSVPARGEARPVSEETDAADINVGRMLETFQLGVRDLQEIWSLVLPPATLFELRKISRLTSDKFTMPDELWARIVYDFALAHRLRTINRDHLLRSMTPLYLAWVGSYTRELQAAGGAAVEQRIERLALAYEAAKPYLISRWRWPDRFNP